MPLVDGTHWEPTHVTDPYDRHQAIVWATVSFVIFMGLNFDFKYRFASKKNDEYGPRILSLVHAALSTFGMGYAMATHEAGWFDAPTTRLEGCWQAMSFAYFLSDTVAMVFGVWDWMYAAHHVVTLACCGGPAFFGVWGFTVGFATVGGEISNLFMHTRWLLHADGHSTQSRSIKVLTFFWFVSFFFLRFFGAPFVVYHMLQTMPWYFSPLTIGIMVFGWKFFVDAFRSEQKGEWWSG